jgi:hypothetical protein
VGLRRQRRVRASGISRVLFCSLLPLEGLGYLSRSAFIHLRHNINGLDVFHDDDDGVMITNLIFVKWIC